MKMVSLVSEQYFAGDMMHRVLFFSPIDKVGKAALLNLIPVLQLTFIGTNLTDRSELRELFHTLQRRKAMHIGQQETEQTGSIHTLANRAGLWPVVKTLNKQLLLLKNSLKERKFLDPLIGVDTELLLIE